MKRLILGKIMMLLVPIAVLGGVYQVRYKTAELTKESVVPLIVGAVLWSLVAWVLIVSGKKARRDSSITQDDNQNCLSCGRWVPAAYLKEGRYCYTCFKKIRNAGEETTHKERHHRESVQNALAGRELFPYQAELDRRIFQFLADEQERDAATMVQAMAESEGDKDKARAKYFQLRYKQMYEAGEVAEFMEEILEKKAM
ncbi:MAG: hypothetical protein PVG97_00470 [Syntrophobacterales bacterium]